MAALTGRERVIRMHRRKDHDRVPRHESYWPETIERWQREGLVGDRDAAYDVLDADVTQLVWFQPAIFPGRHEVVREDDATQDVIDIWGATLRQWKGRSGTPEHLAFGCDSRDVWESVYRPALLNNPVQIPGDHIARRYELAQRKKRWAMIGTIEAYEFMKRVMGDEIALIAMATDPDWIRDVSSTYTDVLIKNLQAILDAGVKPDGVFLSADMGYNHAPMFSPQMYRELIRPDHQRLIDWFHQNDMTVLFHTDGNVNALVDQYVELGIDSLHPLEAAANMCLEELTRTFGTSLSFWGNIDKMVLATNDHDAIEDHIRARLQAGMAIKGYGFHSDHSVPPDVSWETYKFMIDVVDRYGRYD